MTLLKCVWEGAVSLLMLANREGWSKAENSGELSIDPFSKVFRYNDNYP